MIEDSYVVHVVRVRKASKFNWISTFRTPFRGRSRPAALDGFPSTSFCLSEKWCSFYDTLHTRHTSTVTDRRTVVSSLRNIFFNLNASLARSKPQTGDRLAHCFIAKPFFDSTTPASILVIVINGGLDDAHLNGVWAIKRIDTHGYLSLSWPCTTSWSIPIPSVCVCCYSEGQVDGTTGRVDDVFNISWPDGWSLATAVLSLKLCIWLCLPAYSG